mmetsp:Transcript_5326/g.15182  ORF Transcript_5326/g.15182 Transcript_5326/m.15182 type:complete len:230 (-) Transcript_5326:2417-3106(-)
MPRGPYRSAVSAISAKASASRSSKPAIPMLEASPASSSTAPLLLPFFCFPRFSRCADIRESSSDIRLFFIAACKLSRKTTIRSPKCPARNVTHARRGAETSSELMCERTGVSPSAGTIAPAIASSLDSRSSGKDGAEEGAEPDNTWRNILSKICSHSLSGHFCAVSFSFVTEPMRSKERSIVACAAPNHCAGTVSETKCSTRTHTACCERDHSEFQASPVNDLAHARSR